MSDVTLTHDEAVLVAAFLMGRFGAVTIPPNLAPMTSELMAKLPGLTTQTIALDDAARGEES